MSGFPIDAAASSAAGRVPGSVPGASGGAARHWRTSLPPLSKVQTQRSGAVARLRRKRPAASMTTRLAGRSGKAGMAASFRLSGLGLKLGRMAGRDQASAAIPLPIKVSRATDG